MTTPANQASIPNGSPVATPHYLVDANGNPITVSNPLGVNASFSASSIAINDPTTTTNKATVDSSGNLHVAIAGALAAGTNVIGALVANQSVNLAQVGGSNVALGQAAMAASVPVVVASNQGTIPVKGSSTEQATLSAGSLNADLVPATDVSAYKWLSLQVFGTWTGIITFQGSNDNTNWNNVALQTIDAYSTTAATIINASINSIFTGPIAFRYFRVRMTSYTSGTAQGTLELYTSSAAMTITDSYSLQGGSWTVTANAGSGNFNNASVSANGSAIPASSTLIGASDGTNLQQLLVESASNRNLRTAIYNGANQLAIDAAGNQQVKGGFTEQASLSAGSLNADLVPSTDVSAYKSWSLHINANAYSGTLTFQGSNDNSNWIALDTNELSGSSLGSTTTSTNVLYTGIVAFRYLRVRMTSYTSGTAQGTLELYTFVVPFLTSLVRQSGTWTVQPGNTANTTPWLVNASQIGGQAPKLDNTNELGVSLYGKSTTAGDTAVHVNSSGDQYILGDFTEQASLSAGSLNADLVASTDVSAYKSFSIQITGAWTGTLQFQGSNDNVNFSLIHVASQANTQPITSTTVNGLWYGFCSFRYIRIRMTSYTSGTANGVLELYTQPLAPFNVLALASQTGTWTVQPGNTQNTTPWLESIHDGTNKANVLPATSVSNAVGSQGALLTAGAFAEQASLSAGSLNADLVASTDVSNYKWLSIHITGAFTGTLSFQGSNDNANWNSILLQDSKGASANNTLLSSVTGGILAFGPIAYRFLRIRMTSYTSGTANGALELYTSSAVMTQLQAAQSGTWTVQPGNTQNTTPWLVNSPSSDLTVFASGAQTATQTQADQTNNTAKGIKVVLDMTNVGAGPSVTLEIDGKDAASGKYYSILTGAAVTTVSTNVYTVYPGLTASANVAANDVLPHTWRVKVTANNSNSGTYSVGASLLP